MGGGCAVGFGVVLFLQRLDLLIWLIPSFVCFCGIPNMNEYGVMNMNIFRPDMPSSINFSGLRTRQCHNMSEVLFTYVLSCKRTMAKN